MLADGPGSEQGRRLADDLGLPEEIVTVSKWRAASALPRTRAGWSSTISKAADRATFGIELSLRRRAYFGNLMDLPPIRRTDVIHAQWTQWASEVGIGLSSALGAPLTMTARDSFLEGIPAERLVKLQNACAAVALPSRWSRDTWARKTGSERKLHVVYNGIDLEKFRGARPERDRTVPRVIAVGRFHPQKRHADVIRAVAALRKDDVQVECLIVGDGQERGSLERLVRELDVQAAVSFTGEVAFGEVVSFLQQSDVFVLASEAESFGLVTAEAMAAGLPALVADSGASPELIEAGVSGEVFPVGDIERLTDLLKTLIRSREKRDEFGRAGRARVERQFSLAANARQMDALWSEAGGVRPTTARSPTATLAEAE